MTNREQDWISAQVALEDRLGDVVPNGASGGFAPKHRPQAANKPGGGPTSTRRTASSRSRLRVRSTFQLRDAQVDAAA